MLVSGFRGDGTGSTNVRLHSDRYSPCEPNNLGVDTISFINNTYIEMAAEGSCVAVRIIVPHNLLPSLVLGKPLVDTQCALPGVFSFGFA